MTLILQVERLSKSFGGMRAVNALDFAIRRGEIRGLIGPNGSGKTTTINLLSGLLRPDQGTITVAGKRIDGLPAYKRAGFGVARTFQAPAVFKDLSVFQNVLVGGHSFESFGLKLRNVLFRQWSVLNRNADLVQRCMRSLEFVGLDHRAPALAGDLSYGEQKLLDLAKVLVCGPALVLLDEPAGGLDPSQVTQLKGIVARLRSSGTTILFSEHNVSMIMGICDEITVLNFGKKIAEGPPDTIKRHPEVIACYLGTKAADQ